MGTSARTVEGLYPVIPTPLSHGRVDVTNTVGGYTVIAGGTSGFLSIGAEWNELEGASQVAGLSGILGSGEDMAPQTVAKLITAARSYGITQLGVVASGAGAAVAVGSITPDDLDALVLVEPSLDEHLMRNEFRDFTIPKLILHGLGDSAVRSAAALRRLAIGPMLVRSFPTRQPLLTTGLAGTAAEDAANFIVRCCRRRPNAPR